MCCVVEFEINTHINTLFTNPSHLFTNFEKEFIRNTKVCMEFVKKKTLVLSKNRFNWGNWGFLVVSTSMNISPNL